MWSVSLIVIFKTPSRPGGGGGGGILPSAIVNAYNFFLIFAQTTRDFVTFTETDLPWKQFDLVGQGVTSGGFQKFNVLLIQFSCFSFRFGYFSVNFGGFLRFLRNKKNPRWRIEDSRHLKIVTTCPRHTTSALSVADLEQRKQL